MNTEKRLYQWDTGQKLVGCTGLYVDFPIGDEVYRVETADGMCILPDELLQTSGSHKVYECMTNNTIRSFAFSVTPRPKPPDYVYTPTERLTFEGLVLKVDDAVADMIRRAESGEFDGHTPVKGTDYFTTAEIQQIQNEVSSGAIGEFKSVVDTETDKFNANATEKVDTYNQNDSQKTTSYNANATAKLNAYNANANNRVAEFDSHTEQIQTDIGELKSDLTYVEKNINRFFTLYPEFNYEFGYITSNGTEITSTTRIKTKAFLQFPEGASFSIAEGFKYRIYFYTSKDSSTLLVDSMSGYWHTEPYVIDETHSTYYAKIQIANADDSEISDIDSVKNSLTVIYPVTEGDIISRVTNCETEVAKSSISYIPILSAYMESMNSGDVLTVSATFDCNKNDVEEFFANITSFDTLTVAHGGSDRFMGGDVVITNTEVMIKTYNNTVLKSEAHGLTISDFIYVCIEKDDKTNAKVTIMSKSGTYALQTTAGTYYGVNGAIKASTTSELTNATINYIAKDLSKDTWMFRYRNITLNHNGKYMTQLVNMGFADKICSCGYGGAASANIVFDFRNLTAIAKPKRIVWALGMNDKDGDNSVNANWKARYNEVRTYCDSNGIELILATIPNTPSVSTANSYKNEIVRASGYRYIDFAKAVNAESDNASWFDGMLSSDNVHPTELGAKVLASRFLMDVPEII